MMLHIYHFRGVSIRERKLLSEHCHSVYSWISFCCLLVGALVAVQGLQVTPINTVAGGIMRNISATTPAMLNTYTIIYTYAQILIFASSLQLFREGQRNAFDMVLRGSLVSSFNHKNRGNDIWNIMAFFEVRVATLPPCALFLWTRYEVYWVKRIAGRFKHHLIIYLFISSQVYTFTANAAAWRTLCCGGRVLLFVHLCCYCLHLKHLFSSLLCTSAKQCCAEASRVATSWR